MFECRAPKNPKEFEQYYHLRWLMLRKPLQQEKGTEKDKLESQSVHRAIFTSYGNIIAVARLHYCASYQGQIRYMAVSDDFQEKGLGRQLVVALEQHAMGVGINKIILKAREQAIHFYQKLSYQNVGFSHLLNDEIKHFSMEKVISDNRSHLAIPSTELVNVWHQTIPLSKAMNISISYYDQTKLVTTCDEIFNKNLHNTMFAGSIYTLATLTGWGWVYLLIQQQKISGDIVLADANIRYHAPIEGIAFAETNLELSPGNIEHSQSQKKMKLDVEVRIMSGEKIAATFKGLYFVLPKQ
jgi:thioesterase domain-containing protein